MKKQEKGITLIALVITIVVLLILAVVAIGAVQEDGIIQKAKLAVQKYETAKIEEEIALEVLESGAGATETTVDTILKIYKGVFEFSGDTGLAKEWALKYLNTDYEENTFAMCGIAGYNVTAEGKTFTLYPFNYYEGYLMDKEGTVYAVNSEAQTLSTKDKTYKIDNMEDMHNPILSNDKYMYVESFDGSYIVIYYYKGAEEVVDVAKDFNGKHVIGTTGYAFASLEEDANGNPTDQGTEDTVVKKIILPDTLVNFEGYGFFFRTSLESVKLSNNMKSIPSQCFNHCYALKSVNIPESVTSIGMWAFRYCDSLESITIPKNVETIANEAIVSCYKLKTINVNKVKDSISGAPWGATGVTVNWLGE